MRRSDHLKPLSWEHHDALKYAHRLRKGITNGTDPQILRNYLHVVVEQHLRPHFALEESALISRLSEQQRRHDAVQQVLKEHQQMLTLAEEIERQEDDITPLLNTFADRVKQHVKLEEIKLFPYLEETLTPEQLTAAKKELERGHKPGALSWDIPFWKSQAVSK